jgi:GR25 family glycosyltransferase involved in LPS biosynthesis
MKLKLCLLLSSFLLLTGLLQASETTKTGFDFFDHIYTINLEQCTDRKAHVIEEFNKVGIQNYEIFKAIDKDSPEVKKLMESGFVKKYPPCFRCGKLFCKCANNVLIKPQIGNWLSFIHIFEDIVEKNYEFVLITEDDLKFTNDALIIFRKLINFENFSKYKIDLNKPLIIRLYGYFNPKGRDPSSIKFDDNPEVSNACFMVNRKYAESFLNNLHEINTTSDIFIHQDLQKIDHNIQHFSAYPKPAYQLSYVGDSGVTPKFYSTIHPKGIDESDIVRKKNHRQRVEFWEYLLDKCGFPAE